MKSISLSIVAIAVAVLALSASPAVAADGTGGCNGSPFHHTSACQFKVVKIATTRGFVYKRIEVKHVPPPPPYCY